MNVKQITAALVAVGSVAGSALAQQAAPELVHARGDFVKQGTVEYGFDGSYSASEFKNNNGAQQPGAPFDPPTVRKSGTDNALTILTTAGEINYFVMDKVSVGVTANFDYLFGNQKGGPQFDSVLMYAEPTVRYHFRLNTKAPVYPYVGAGLGGGMGWFNNQVGPDPSPHHANQTTMVTYSGQVGIKIPLDENVYFDTCLKYTDYHMATAWTVDQNWQILFGFKIKL